MRGSCPLRPSIAAHLGRGSCTSLRIKNRLCGAPVCPDKCPCPPGPAGAHPMTLQYSIREESYTNAEISPVRPPPQSCSYIELPLKYSPSPLLLTSPGVCIPRSHPLLTLPNPPFLLHRGACGRIKLRPGAQSLTPKPVPPSCLPALNPLSLRLSVPAPVPRCGSPSPAQGRSPVPCIPAKPGPTSIQIPTLTQSSHPYRYLGGAYLPPEGGTRLVRNGGWKRASTPAGPNSSCEPRDLPSLAPFCLGIAILATKRAKSGNSLGAGRHPQELPTHTPSR